MKLLIIDGNGLIVRDFYATAPYQRVGEPDNVYRSKLLHTKDGRISNAIAVALPGILRYILYFNPDMVAVCFDRNRNTFRRAIYPAYKAQRNPAPIPLKEQIIAMQEILKKIGIPTFVTDAYEADDIVCTIARQFAEKEAQVDIISSDHDYMQLVGDNITVWRPQKTVEDADALYESFGYSKEERAQMPRKLFPYSNDMDVAIEMGVNPSQVPDIKGLAGDASDNIPGVYGISDKTAGILLNTFESIEGIYSALYADSAKFLRTCKDSGIKRSPEKALLNGMRDAFLCRTLATMVSIPGFEANEDMLKLKMNLLELRNIEDDWELRSAHDVIVDCIYKFKA